MLLLGRHDAATTTRGNQLLDLMTHLRRIKSRDPPSSAVFGLILRCAVPDQPVAWLGNWVKLGRVLPVVWWVFEGGGPL